MLIFQVSWIKRKDYHLLTVGLTTYSGDERFQAIHVQHSEVSFHSLCFPVKASRWNVFHFGRIFTYLFLLIRLFTRSISPVHTFLISQGNYIILLNATSKEKSQPKEKLQTEHPEIVNCDLKRFSNLYFTGFSSIPTRPLIFPELAFLVERVRCTRNALL